MVSRSIAPGEKKSLIRYSSSDLGDGTMGGDLDPRKLDRFGSGTSEPGAPVSFSVRLAD